MMTAADNRNQAQVKAATVVAFNSINIFMSTITIAIITIITTIITAPLILIHPLMLMLMLMVMIPILAPLLPPPSNGLTRTRIRTRTVLNGSLLAVILLMVHHYYQREICR